MIAQETAVRDYTFRLIFDSGKAIEIHGPADITRETTDAIVNAANSSLLGGGGVDGAIHRAGGPAILAECRAIVSKIKSLPAGQAVITTGGQLVAKHVIHTVGPIYRDGTRGEPEVLASCYRESIRLADEKSLTSVSFPAISTGAYGYPVHEAAQVALNSAVCELLNARNISLARFVLFDHSNLRAYEQTIKRLPTSTSVSFKLETSHS